MQIIKSASLLCIAFGLGFLVNEYRHHLADIAPHSNKETGAVQSAHSAPSAHVPAFTAAEPSTAEVEAPPAFTWERVTQLINDQQFDAAIRLLQQQLNEEAQSPAQIWFYLAQIYQRQQRTQLAVDAWFHYLDSEIDAQKLDQAIVHLKNYLTRFFQQSLPPDENTQWLIAQLERLTNYSAGNGELHLMLASLYLKISDDYQAQYHALMASNFPATQKPAEEILAQLNGTSIPDELAVPLIPFGNQYLVAVTIEGHPARLLLDTGASISGLSERYTAKFPSIVKSTKPIRLNTASGSVESFLFTVSSVDVGDLALSQHILAQLPMDSSAKFDGLLGVDILGRFHFDIDQQEQVLRLQAKEK